MTVFFCMVTVFFCTVSLFLHTECIWFHMGIGWSQRLQINEANQQHQEHFLLRSLIPVIIISIENFRGNSIRFYSYFFTGGRG